MQINGVTPRRVFLYSLLGAGVALGGNLFGVTSGLLGALAPKESRDARLDVLYPVGGFKRYRANERGEAGSVFVLFMFFFTFFMTCFCPCDVSRLPNF